MKKLLFVFFAGLSVIAGCSFKGDTIAGASGGSETTNGIRAMVVMPNNAPAANMTVRLRRSDYVASLPTLGKTAIYGADAITDSLGRFAITGLDSGAYTIEVTDNVTNALLLTCALNHGDTADLGINTLRPFGILHGTLDSASLAAGRLFVQVRGLERTTQPDAVGVFSFSDLPAGALGLRISTQDAAAYPARTIYGIPVRAADTARVALRLPAPWQETGINETPSGSVAIVNNTFVLSGGGPDIYDTADGFHFVYQPWSGDVTLVARVTGLDSTHENAKACLMVRQSLSAGSLFAAEEVEPPGIPVPTAAAGEKYCSLYLDWRQTVGDTTPYVAQGPPVLLPRFIKLTRQGDTLTGYHSVDGVNWIQQTSAVVAMSADVYIGLGVTSHRLDKTCTAVFDSVQILP